MKLANVSCRRNLLPPPWEGRAGEGSRRRLRLWLTPPGAASQRRPPPQGGGGRKVLRWLLPVLLVLDVSAASSAEDTIKVGILHSLSGTMAISESALKDTVLMLVADQNKRGGLLGRKLEPVIVDPASDANAFTEKALELLAKEKAAVVFGCWTSTSRKAVIPVFERLNGLLFYPVQHEGEESSRNVFYTGAAPNQQAIPAVRYLMSKEGGAIRRWVLLGTDLVYPRTTNRILGAYLEAEGVPRTISRHSIRRLAIPTGARLSRGSRRLARRGKKPPSSRLSAGTQMATCTTNWQRSRWTPQKFRSWPCPSASANCKVQMPAASPGTWRRGIISSQ